MSDILKRKINARSANQKNPISRQQNIVIEETEAVSPSSPDKATKKFGLIKRITNFELVSSSNPSKDAELPAEANRSFDGLVRGRKFNDRLIKDFEAKYSMPSKNFQLASSRSNFGCESENGSRIGNVKSPTNCLMTPSMDASLSRKSSVNSVRYQILSSDRV